MKVTQNLSRNGADKILTSGVVAAVFMMAAGIDVGGTNGKLSGGSASIWTKFQIAAKAFA